MRVMLWVAFGKEHIEAALQKIAGVELTVVDSKQQAIEELPHTEVFILLSVSYDQDVATAVRTHGARLKWIQVLSAGYEELRVHGVSPGVTVSNAGDAWSPAVAEHAMTLLLSLVKGIPTIVAQQARHEWNRSITATMGGLYGKTLAIVGFGSIGKEVARRAGSFGMRIVGVSRQARPDPLADEVKPITALHAVLASADIVLLSVPSSTETEGLFGRAEFAACKRGAILINVARGAIVDQDCLIEALSSGAISAAGLDVTNPEPLPADHPLWDCPNVLISPHVAGACGISGITRLVEVVVANIERYGAGKTVSHIVSI
jgi:phosphoglycerate dehydrogenase-like enzyme